MFLDRFDYLYHLGSSLKYTRHIQMQQPLTPLHKARKTRDIIFGAKSGHRQGEVFQVGRLCSERERLKDRKCLAGGPLVPRQVQLNETVLSLFNKAHECLQPTVTQICPWNRQLSDLMCLEMVPSQLHNQRIQVR